MIKYILFGLLLLSSTTTEARRIVTSADIDNVKAMLDLLPDNVGEILTDNSTNMHYINKDHLLVDIVLARSINFKVRDNELARRFFDLGLPLILNHIQRMDFLEHVSLVNCNLTTVPSALFGLLNLKTLDLSQNGISVLPEEICNLSFLKKLNLRENCFRRLPIAILNLDASDFELDLMSNPLRDYGAFNSMGAQDFMYYFDGVVLLNDVEQIERLLPQQTPAFVNGQQGFVIDENQPPQGCESKRRRIR